MKILVMWLWIVWALIAVTAKAQFGHWEQYLPFVGGWTVYSPDGIKQLIGYATAAYSGVRD